MADEKVSAEKTVSSRGVEIMRLVLCVNHAAPFNVGGSEKVVQQISESMVNEYGMEVYVLAKWAGRDHIRLNGVNIVPSKAGSAFVDQLKKLNPDHTMVYSDSFFQLPQLIASVDEIPGSKSLVMVGMNHMRSNGNTFNAFKEVSEQFQVITHSNDYKDYSTCISTGITPIVIPNAIDFDEFQDKKLGFRRRFDIPEDKKLILCVSNFFPGKGQEHLHHMLQHLGKKRNDFYALFMSTNVSFHQAESMRRRHETAIRKGCQYPAKSLKQISRELTVQAFFESDIFAFPSQTEVAPLVILESMAAALPYVSLNVGNVPQLAGGIVCHSNDVHRGLLKYTMPVYDKFSEALELLLSDDEKRKSLGEQGRQMILDKHDWSKIKEMYRNVFCSEVISYNDSI